MLLLLAIFASIASGILVFFVLFLALRTNSRLTAIERQQGREFTRLKNLIAELREQQPAAPSDEQTGEQAAVGAESAVEIGDQVAITDGPHEGEHGTVIPPPYPLRQGVVCVDLADGQGRRYVDVFKLARLNKSS